MAGDSANTTAQVPRRTIDDTAALGIRTALGLLGMMLPIQLTKVDFQSASSSSGRTNRQVHLDDLVSQAGYFDQPSCTASTFCASAATINVTRIAAKANLVLKKRFLRQQDMPAGKDPESGEMRVRTGPAISWWC